MKKLLPLVLLLIVSLGCEGPEGPTGPRGRDGVDGNANVAAVPAGYVDPESWLQSSTGNIYFYNVTVSSITEDIVDNGSVLVYFSTNGTDWLLTPFTNRINADEFYIVDALHLVGMVQIRFRHSDPNQSYAPFSRVYFKIIIIESSTLAKNSHSQIDWENYYDVKQKFNLKD